MQQVFLEEDCRLIVASSLEEHNDWIADDEYRWSVERVDNDWFENHFEKHWAKRRRRRVRRWRKTDRQTWVILSSKMRTFREARGSYFNCWLAKYCCKACVDELIVFCVRASGALGSFVSTYCIRVKFRIGSIFSNGFYNSIIERREEIEWYTTH